MLRGLSQAQPKNQQKAQLLLMCLNQLRRLQRICVRATLVNQSASGIATAINGPESGPTQNQTKGERAQTNIGIGQCTPRYLPIHGPSQSKSPYEAATSYLATGTQRCGDQLRKPSTRWAVIRILSRWAQWWIIARCCEKEIRTIAQSRRGGHPVQILILTY